MNKTFTNIIVCGFLCLPGLLMANGNQPLPGSNLLANASFEQPAKNDNKAQNWNDYGAGYTRSRKKSYQPDVFGAWSCKISSRGGDEKPPGAVTLITAGLPEQGEFEGSVGIYIENYAQGKINYYYVSVEYTDNTTEYHQWMLNKYAIKDNLGRWKRYYFNFKTKPEKKIKSMGFFFLTGKNDDGEFIGTVYFDEPRLALKRLNPSVPGFLVKRAISAPVIDAKKDDVYRQGSELSRFSIIRDGSLAKQQTRAYAVYDESKLYFYVECDEHILDPVLQQRDKFRANETTRDGNLWSDDCVEIFLSAAENTNNYYHFIMNSRGALYDAACTRKPDGEITMDKSWNSSAQFSARVDEPACLWMAEIAIPFKDLASAQPAAGDCWRMNVCREQKADAENSAWAPAARNFHQPVLFGEMIFGGNVSLPAMHGLSINPLMEGANELVLQLANNDEQSEIVETAIEITSVNPDGYTRSAIEQGFWRIAPGSAKTVNMPFSAPRHTRNVSCRLYCPNGLFYSSPCYPLVINTPFVIYHGSVGIHAAMPISEFYAVQDDMLYVPVVLRGPAEGALTNAACDGSSMPTQLRGPAEGALTNARFFIEVPDFMRMISNAGNSRSNPWQSPLEVTEIKTNHAEIAYRRYCLTLNTNNFTLPSEAELKKFRTTQLFFKIGTPGTKSAANKPCDLFYYLEIDGKTSLAGQVKLNLLEPFSGKKNDRTIFMMWNWLNYSQMGKAEAQERFNSFKMAGFNLFLNQGGNMDRFGKEYDFNIIGEIPCMLEEAHLPTVLKKFGLEEYLRKNPDKRSVSGKGEIQKNIVSPAHLLETNSPPALMLKEYVTKNFAKYPFVCLDYEGSPLGPNALGFDALNLEVFRKYARIDKKVKLDPDVIARDYKAQWIDFRNWQVAEKFRLFHEIVKEANPNCKIVGYSGYESAYTRDHYSINWNYISPYIDIAECGYGRQAQAAKDTIKAVGNKPLIGGEITYIFQGYDFSMAEINLFQRLTDCGGGVMLYDDWSTAVDNRLLKALSKISSVAADFPKFFAAFEPDENTPIIREGDAGNVTVLKNGAERLVFIFNVGNKTCRFRIGLKDIAGGATGITYWTKKKIKVRPELEIEVEPGKVEVVYIAMPRKTLEAPQVTGAIQKWRQRLRNLFCRGTPPPAPKITGAGGWPCPLLRWSDADGARNYYVVEYSRDSGFPKLKTAAIRNVPVNFCLIEDSLEQNAKYHWRVRAVDVISGAASTWSETGEFVVAGEWR
ncbi:MAG: carbohydrate-binding family 9-like protein [Verrucomicrobiota bacterium]